MQVKTKGIVLSETPYSETSKILNILTEDYGLIGVMSRGSRNIKNKLRGISNKMNYCEYTISYKEKTLSTLIEGNIINSFKNTYNDMKKAIYSFYLMDLTYQVLKENNTKEIFPLLSWALLKINDGLSPEFVSNILELRFLKYLGVSLNLDSCVKCGSKKDFITVDLNSGGVICKNCYNDEYLFNEKALKLFLLFDKVDINKLKKLEITDSSIFQEIDKFLHEYYNSYTGIYLREKNNLEKINII